MEYVPQQKRRFDAMRVAKNEMYLPGKLNGLINTADAAGRFLWQITSGILRYAANRIPEIADDIVNIDRAMRWGFAWKMGPFEMLDRLGPARVGARLETQGRRVPRMLEVLRKSGGDRFYRDDETFLAVDGTYTPLP